MACAGPPPRGPKTDRWGQGEEVVPEEFHWKADIKHCRDDPQKIQAWREDVAL
jgi:hypothetical protein